MSTLQDLINTHNVTTTPIYVDSFDGSPTGQRDHDIYDVLLTIDTDINLYGGSDNPRKRTMLFRGYGQSPADSLPQNGGDLVPPTTDEVLEALLTDASYANYESAKEWAEDYQFEGDAEAEWAKFTAVRADLEYLLGDLYQDFADSL